MDSAITTLIIEPPRIETSAIASKMSGKAIMASIRRDIGASRRRKNPAIRPIAIPIIEASAATPKPIVSDIRPA